MTDNIIAKVEDSDEGKTAAVALYLIELEYDGLRYAGQLPARNLDEAKIMAIILNAKMYGRITAEKVDAICPVCANDFPLEEKTAELMPDEDWPEVL
jgi:hypothetical protein